MINRIDEKNHYTYPNPKIKNRNIPNADEKFNLNYNKEELQAEDGEKKEKADKAEQSGKQAEEQSGVRLELSSRGKTASVDELKAAEAAKTQASAEPSILGLVREAITAVVSAVKEFFYKIWNEPDVKVESGAETEAEAEAGLEMNTETETLSETGTEIETAAKDSAESTMPIPASIDSRASLKTAEERLDREIRPYLRKGDLNQVINLLTDNGKKTVAMNSTLLTYYDRNGKMVEINASDRERILRGDRNTKKL